MSNKDGDVLNSAEAAIFSLHVAKDNIENYLALHGLKPSATGEVGKQAEFNMGGVKAKAEFDSAINESLKQAIKNIERFVESQKS